MEYNKKLFCPICLKLYDSSFRIPLILPNCCHSMCSECIKKIITKNNNSLICPIDKISYKEIRSIDKLKINKRLLDNIKDKKYSQNNSKEIITEFEDISNSKEISSKDFLKTETFNDLNNSFSSTFINLKSKKENNSICSVHLLPNNIICINDKIKICSQCAKNKLHINHEILTEDELLKQIENLIDKYQEIEKKNICYNFNKLIENISKKDINKNIDEKINNLKDSVNLIKNDIINNINIQFEQIIYYLDFRNKELKEIFNNNFIEIQKLKEDFQNWKKITCNKLDKLNEINNISLECFKLLDKEPNNNFTYLFQKGISLNEKYNNLNKIIDNLVKFCDNGIIINSNNDLIEKIKFIYKKKKNYQKLNNILLNKNNKDNYIINSKLFNISENEQLINELNLTKFYFENENTNSLNKSIDKKKDELKKRNEKHFEFKENLNPIITLKQNYNNNIYNNYNNYNYQNNMNYNINIKSNSPRVTNNNKKTLSNKKDDNNEKKFYKINLNKKNLRNKNRQGKNNTINNNISESVNQFIPKSSRNNKDNISNKNQKEINNKTSIYVSNNIKKINDFENSKISKIINPIENNSFQDSFNNISNIYYLSSLLDKNINFNNVNEISNIKDKLDTENSLSNLSKMNSNTFNENIKINSNSNNIEIKNLIIEQLKNKSPNFNGKKMNGNNMIMFCNILKKSENIKFNELLMEHCCLNDDDVNLLINTLIDKNIIFEMLDLSWNELTDQSGLCILELIKKNNSLNILLLNNNSFSVSLKKKFESYVNLGRKGLEKIKFYI